MNTLTVRALRATAVEVPMNHVLGTSAAAVVAAPLLLIDLETDEGVTGRAYLFCYLRGAAPAMAAMVAEVERMVKGERLPPRELWPRMAKRFTLIGVQGIVRMAMAGFDMAWWDAHARGAGKPLVEFLGGSRRPIRAYNSCGLGLMDMEALARETDEMLEGVDTLVFDIQDIGTRFYTYACTMANAMEAAAGKGVRFVVLDRPNPITGEHVEGPILDPGLKSFVGCMAIPIRHGMTVG